MARGTKTQRKIKWEYQIVECVDIALQKYVLSEVSEIFFAGEDGSDNVTPQDVKREELKQSRLIDPEIWNTVPRDNQKHLVKLVWSEKDGYYTSLARCLNELGNEGWEVSTSTPPWNESTREFHIVLKRPI